MSGHNVLRLKFFECIKSCNCFANTKYPNDAKVSANTKKPSHFDDYNNDNHDVKTMDDDHNQLKVIEI